MQNFTSDFSALPGTEGGLLQSNDLFWPLHTHTNGLFWPSLLLLTAGAGWRPLVAVGEFGHVLFNKLCSLLFDRVGTLEIFNSSAMLHLLCQDVVGQLKKKKTRFK